MPRATFSIAAAAFGLALGCSDGASPPVPAQVVVSPSVRTAQTVGETVQYSAQVLDADGIVITGAEVAWTAASAAIATVSETGLVTVVGPGETSIRAAHETVSGEAILIVELEPAEMTRVSQDDLTAPALSVVPEDPTVRIVDAGGAPIPGLSVTFEILTGAGQVTPSTGTTDSDGEASTRWTLGDQTGTQRLRATVGTFQVEFTATATTPALAIRTLQLERGRVTLGYAEALETLGGTPPFLWSVASGTLPAGIGLTDDGLLTGTPTADGDRDFVVRVEDGEGASATRDLTLRICEGPLSMSVGEVVAMGPTEPAGCPPFLPSGQAGDRYRIGVVRTSVSDDLSLVPIDVTVTAHGTVASPSAPSIDGPPAQGEWTLPEPFATELRRAEATGQFHRFLHEQAQRLIETLGPAAVLSDTRPGNLLRPLLDGAGAPPPDRIVLKPYDSSRSNEACQLPAPTNTVGRLVAFNDGVAIYQDSVQATSDPIEVTHAQQVLDYYDAYGRSTITDYFGGVSDINADERVNIFVSPVVGSSLAAFVWPGDFIEVASCPWSNEQELIYFNEEMFDAIAEGAFQALPVLVHETKHVSSTFRRLAAGTLHPSWVEEGSAEIAAEISSRKAMEAVGDVAQGALLTRDAFPPMNIAGPENYGVILRLARMTRSYAAPVNSLSTNPGGDHTFYGTSWHFHRFLGDAYGNAASKADGLLFVAQNDTTSRPGPDGFTDVTGTPMTALLEEYAAAMMLNGTNAPQPTRAFTTYEFTTATDIFVPSAQPPGTYPWPHTGPTPAGFQTATYSGSLAPVGLRIHDLESNGSGAGVEVAVTVTGGAARVVLTRIN